MFVHVIVGRERLESLTTSQWTHCVFATLVAKNIGSVTYHKALATRGYWNLGKVLPTFEADFSTVMSSVSSISLVNAKLLSLFLSLSISIMSHEIDFSLQNVTKPHLSIPSKFDEMLFKLLSLFISLSLNSFLKSKTGKLK